MAVQHQPAVHHPEPPSGFLRRWVFSTDHKVIGIQYWGLAILAVIVGMTLSYSLSPWSPQGVQRKAGPAGPAPRDSPQAQLSLRGTP